MRPGGAPVAAAEQRMREIRMRLGMSGRHGDRSAQGLQRFGQSSRLQTCDAEGHVRLDLRGREMHGALERLQSGSRVPGCRAGISKVDERRNVVGLYRQCLAETGDRIERMAELAQRLAQVDEGS